MGLLPNTEEKENSGGNFLLQYLTFQPDALIPDPLANLCLLRHGCPQHREAELGTNFGASFVENSDGKVQMYHTYPQFFLGHR